MTNRQNCLNTGAKFDTTTGESAKRVVNIGFEFIIGLKFNMVHLEQQICKTLRRSFQMVRHCLILIRHSSTDIQYFSKSFVIGPSYSFVIE